MSTKTPQEKKKLSYAKDRRNTFGENSKASRKGIPLAKARSIRAERHEKDIVLAAAMVSPDPDQLAAVDLQVKARKPRQWKKTPDKPLGEVLARRTRRKSS
jgi:hypothetical protein